MKGETAAFNGGIWHMCVVGGKRLLRGMGISWDGSRWIDEDTWMAVEACPFCGEKLDAYMAKEGK